MPFADILTQKLLALYTFGGSLVTSVFLSPPRYVWGICGAFVALGSFGLLLKNRFIQSNPNEWLLIIRQGKMIKAGVGLKTFIGLTDSFVKFPSKVEQVQFTANNVTKEMQGVQITGFAFWSVYREDDGPFRCYKYMQGGDANRNVQAMCESVLRNLIANSSLDDVLRNRNHLRDNMKKDLKDQFKGWGIWLQTVQITQVKISSQRLFKDLQAQFRQDARLKAQQIELSSEQKINSAKQQSQMKQSEATQLNQTRKLTTRNNQRIKRDQQQAEYDNQKNELQIKRLERQSKFQIQKIKNEFNQEKQRIENEQNAARLKQDFQLEYIKKRIELDKTHDEKSLLKYQIDATQRIYGKINLREIKLNQFSGDSKSNFMGMLPTMGLASMFQKQ